MENTIFFAQVIGTYALVMGASMALRKEMVLGVFRDVAKERSVSYILGVVIFILGLLIIFNYNVWTSPASTLITLLGWMVTVLGAGFLFASEKQLKSFLSWLNEDVVYYAIAFGYLIIGAYLVCIGFDRT